MTSLRSFVLTRLLLLIPMMWILLTLIFFILRVMPGANPVRVMSPQLPEEQIQMISERMGLNDPLEEQYLDFFYNILSLDFGDSYQSKVPIIDELQLAFGPTFMLAIGGSLIGIPMGVYLGAYAGNNREKIPDHLIRIFTLGVYSLPIFLIGIYGQIIFGKGYELDLLPPLDLVKPGGTAEFTHYTEIWFLDALLSGRPDIAFDILKHLLMPCTALGMLIAASIARQVRINTIYELEQNYVHFARSRGIPERQVKYKYALKNAVAPTFSLIGLQFALLLAGAILTETTFNIPGLGRYLFFAISNKDYPAVQGALVLLILVVSVVSIISDIFYAIIDPRIKY